MLNVLIALRVFYDAWCHKSVCMYIDNKAAVFALQKCRIRDSFMQAVARSVWLIAASYDITLIAGINNKKADMLSRVFQSAVDLNCVHKQFENCVWWKVDGHMFYPNTLI